MGQRQAKASVANMPNWTQLGKMGIDRQVLEASGELDRLLAGEESGIMNVSSA
ncbi:MAG TPA: DUF4099 domain-containing protein [Candidatus Prevotella stercoripullorum]|nr:DUF4099 domain-containing protein [Candidatus Prevotella stercoripullorum]